MDVTWEMVAGLFLVAHAVAHASVTVPAMGTGGKQLGWTGRSWLLTGVLGEVPVRRFGVALGVIAALGFVGAGLGFLGVDMLAEWWRTLAVSSALISLVFSVLVFPDLMPRPRMYAAWPVINLGVVAALVWVWPA